MRVNWMAEKVYVLSMQETFDRPPCQQNQRFKPWDQKKQLYGIIYTLGLYQLNSSQLVNRILNDEIVQNLLPEAIPKIKEK